jgi:sigma-B regulation protein RsbU (phosphoserine phosphatase)
MTKKKTLGKKILYAMIMVVVGMLLAASVILTLTIRNISGTLSSSNRNLSETISEESTTYLSNQSKSRLVELARKSAEIADGIFSNFRQGVVIVGSVAGEIYNNPERYSPNPAPLPDPKNDGVLTTQVLYSASTDPADPAIQEELALIGNVQDVLMAVNASQDNMASIYVATESGFMVQADYISAKKFDEGGNLMPLEAKERPWYQGAAATGEPFFTPVTKDAHTPRLAIMCGVPVFRGDELAAVAGAGMYLDEMENLVQSVNLGNSGKACIINENGQVLFSTFDEGSFAAVVDAPDLRLSEDWELARIARDATSGGAGLLRASVDGVSCYVSYAPMKIVGWSMVVFLPQEAVEEPTNRLLANVDQVTDQTVQNATDHIRYAVYLLLGLLGVAVLIAIAVSVRISHQIVEPIRLLTEEVGTMEGGNLDFQLKLDTGDETQVLADSFRGLTLRMKEYISDIESITAENERINTELSLAASIQSHMLPGVFPPFPDKKEVDIFASMDAAKEVGGDFYDFFLIDDDHLCLLIADVSGKGVPAALFMMACKIMLNNYAMLSKSPAKLLETVNTAICGNNKDTMFVTVWAGILDLKTGLLTAANAGHEYPVWIRKGKSELYKDKHGLVIGAMEGIHYPEYQIQLTPGDKLFVYTDGVAEAEDENGTRFGTDRMLAALDAGSDRSPEGILEAVRQAVDNFVGDAEQFDDLTMLCLEYRGTDETDRLT